MKLKTIEEAGNLRGKRVLLRLDLNVPIEAGVIKDDFRIKQSLKTIDYIRKEGGKVVIISHIESEGNDTLRDVAEYLKISFVDSMGIETVSERIDLMKEGDAIILENLRKDPREKNNDETFARKLSSFADIFVNEAFSVSHREHASIVQIPKFLPSFFGFSFIEEVNNLSRAFHPEHPFVFILGGAKFETKLPLVKKFLEIADKIFIGGALANSFFREMGYEIGHSLSDKKDLNLRELSLNKKVIIPGDVVVKGVGGGLVKRIEEVGREDVIVDVGPEFTDEISESISSAKFVLWNGPLGLTEENFNKSTRATAEAVVESRSVSILGGGDTVFAVKNMNILDKFSFVSTGGGAMLDFLANGTLPGIEAIINKQ